MEGLELLPLTKSPGADQWEEWPTSGGGCAHCRKVEELGSVIAGTIVYIAIEITKKCDKSSVGANNH